MAISTQPTSPLNFFGVGQSWVTGEPNLSPTSQVSSAENTTGSVISTLLSPTLGTREMA
jgi:hypothetical protein